MSAPAIFDLIKKVKKLEDKTNMITLVLQDTYTIVNTNTYEEIPLQELNKIGDKLTYSENGIVIGKGISKVEVSYTVKYETIEKEGQKYASLYKNDTTTLLLENVYASGRCIISASPIIINVAENDVLTLKVYGQAGDKIRTSSTYITVRVIE